MSSALNDEEGAAAGSIRILVVDDHDEVLELVSRALVRDQHQVRTAATAQEARIELERSWAQLVVLDLGLPDGAGEDLCAWLRQRGPSPAILILTAHSAVHSRVRCLDLGADDYLTKPFAVAELRARVRALGRRSIHAPVALRRVGDGLLDFSKRRALVGGAEVPLTAREWAILRALVEADGAIVARGDLLERIWGRDGKGQAASLDVLVGRIRRKLGSSTLRTVRGQGYALGDG
jgi:DNA-binding response OmpR family regulator